MSESIQHNHINENAKTGALIAYGLMAIGLFTGLFWLIGGIWAIIKKDDAKGTIYLDHYEQLIRTFWIGIILNIVGFILLFIVVGYFVLIAVWLWSVYKVVKGLARITSDRPYYDR